MKKTFLNWTLFLASFLLFGCGTKNSTPSSSQQATTDNLNVVTTFYPIYEFTKAVVGDTGKVSLLIPAGTEPHDYEPSAKDMAKMADADAVVYNSQELETWVKNAQKSIGKNNFIEAAKGITLAEGKEEEEHEEKTEHAHNLDPHVWLDPVLASQEVQTIQEQLSQQFPELKETFLQNAKAYQEKLAALDKTFFETLKDAKARTFITQHAAFGYLAKRYNLVQEAVSGLSPNEEPSPNRLLELKEFVTAHHLPVIYFEENASSKVAEVLAKEANVKTSVLNTLESVSEKEQKAGKDYFTIMEENLKNLQLSIQ